MKKSLLFSLVFSATVSVATSTTIGPLSQAETTHASLKNFVALSKRCHASAQATDNQESFDAFKKINTFFIKHRAAFENIKELDDATAEKLAQQCSQVLTGALSQVTRANRSPAPQEELPLDESMKIFTRAMPNLLAPTKTQTLIQRLILLSIVETSFFLIESNIKEENKSNASTKMPTISERFKKMGSIDLSSKNFMKLFGLGIARALSIGAINEYSPKGISSYIHRLAENLLPKIVAILTAGTLLYSKEGKLSGRFMRSAVLRIINPFILGRGFLDKSHALYQPLLISSYVFPFFSGTSGGIMFGGSDFSPNAWANVLVDGISGSAIYSGIPYATDRLIPKRMALNPEHRRKALKNSVRSMFDTVYAQWNQVAFKKG